MGAGRVIPNDVAPPQTPGMPPVPTRIHSRVVQYFQPRVTQQDLDRANAAVLQLGARKKYAPMELQQALALKPDSTLKPNGQRPREEVVASAVQMFQDAAGNAVTSMTQEANGAWRTLRVTNRELGEIGHQLWANNGGVTSAEVAEISKRLGAEFLAARDSAAQPHKLDGLGDAVDAVDDFMKPVFAQMEEQQGWGKEYAVLMGDELANVANPETLRAQAAVGDPVRPGEPFFAARSVHPGVKPTVQSGDAPVELDLSQSHSGETRNIAKRLGTTPHGQLDLSLPPQTMARIGAQLAQQPPAALPSSNPEPMVDIRCPEPLDPLANYEVEPHALLGMSSKTAGEMGGLTPPNDTWKVGNNTVPNQWSHTYGGRFAAALFTEAVTQITGKDKQTAQSRRIIEGAGDLFGAAVLGFREKTMNQHVTPDDILGTVSRTYKLRLSPTEVIEVTPQVTLSAGDMHNFGPGSAYFSVNVKY